MLILPYKTDLRLNSRPYVVYLVIFLCVVVYYFDLSFKLMYYPNTLNVLKMITSTLSHANPSHIIFNLIFFIAFAPALELIVENKLKFILTLLAITFLTSIFYSIVSIIDGENIPTLGLSGVVMGMIGLSAYIMPWARIRTLLWLFTYVRLISVPAWILASWFIGWDVYELFTRTSNGGVNLIAHVAGGLSGYFIGMFFFKERKIYIEKELNVEIDYMRAKRDKFSSYASTYKGDMAYVDNKAREHEAKKEFGRFRESLFRQIRAGKSREALLFLLKDYDLYKESPEIYENLFYEIGEWDKKRVYLCTGRLVIGLLIKNNLLRETANIIKLCIEIDENFVLSDPEHLSLITNYLVETNHSELAYKLVSHAKSKYGDSLIGCDHVLLEAKLLWQYFNNSFGATAVLNNALNTSSQECSVKLKNLLNFVNTA